MMFALADILSSAVTPNGLFVYRSKLFGGMSAEVLTIFNKSNLLIKLKGNEIPCPLAYLIFFISRMQSMASFRSKDCLRESRWEWRMLLTYVHLLY